MTLRRDDRDARIQDHRAWLSFPFIYDDTHGYLLSEIDVEFLVDPVLRPEETVKREPVKGVVIDPGHGGADRGARDDHGYTEKQANLSTANYLRPLLEADGIDVVMTRERDVYVSLQERARIANRYPGYLFISIHYNSVHIRSANGIETYSMTPQGAGSTSAGGRVRSSDQRRYHGNRHDHHNALLMNYMHQELMTMHTRRGDRGLKRARFLVLREVKIPAVLVEGGFMSHHIDARLIRSDSYKEKVAQAIHRGIRRYLEVMNAPMVAERFRLTTPASETSKPGEPAGEQVAVAEGPEAAETGETPKAEADRAPALEPLPPQDVSLRAPAIDVVQRLREAIERVHDAESDGSSEAGETLPPADLAPTEVQEEAKDGG